MSQVYDAIVVGAGPAGSVAARKLAASGLHVLLIEKRQEIGAPVRCAEAVGIDSTRPYIDIDDRWVDAHIATFSIHSSAGDIVRVPPTEPSLVLNRKVFDWELAHLASRSGAVVHTKTQATGLIWENGHTVGIHIDRLGKTSEVRAPLVIAADGTESQVVRWAGLKSVPALSDLYVGFQYLLGNLQGRIDPTNCEYHLDNNAFCGGYGWVFPKGDDVANVGLVIPADQAARFSAQARLEHFVETRYPGSNVLGVVAGGIPVTGALKKMVTDGVMAVGDAAHQADPLLGGGIGLGMTGADLAAQVAVEALSKGDVSAKALSKYEMLWQNRFGAQHRALYRVRKWLANMEEIRRIALIRAASELPLETMSLGQILFALFKTNPAMLMEATMLISTGLILK